MVSTPVLMQSLNGRKTSPSDRPARASFSMCYKSWKSRLFNVPVKLVFEKFPNIHVAEVQVQKRLGRL